MIAVMPAIEELGQRGHQVTVFSPFNGVAKNVKNGRKFFLEAAANYGLVLYAKRWDGTILDAYVPFQANVFTILQQHIKSPGIFRNFEEA